MFKLKDYFTKNDSVESSTDDCNGKETLAEFGEIDSINMMNAYVSHQELLEHCFNYTIYRPY